MTQSVQRGIGQSVHGIERCEAQSGRFSRLAPAPEFLDSGRGNPFCFRIPQTEVNLDRRRALRIEVISAPAPTRLPNQQRKMIGRKLFRAGDGFVTEPAQQLLRFRGLFRPAEDINIVLRPHGKLAVVPNPLRKAFQDQRIDARGFEHRCDFAIRFLEALEAQRGAGLVPGNARTHCLGQCASGAPRECKRNVDAVRKIQERIPLLRVKLLQIGRRRRIEPQRGDHGSHHARVGPKRQKSSLSPNCIRRGCPLAKIFPKNGPKSGYWPGMPQFG